MEKGQIDARLLAAEKKFLLIEATHAVLCEEFDSKNSLLVAAKKSQADHAVASQIALKVSYLYKSLALQEVERLVSQALNAVFQRQYECRLVQTSKRDQSEVSIVILDGSREMDPVTSMGGGILDVISLALRVVIWALSPRRTDAIMVLDEPARLVNSDQSVSNLADLLKLLSQSLAVQFLVVTNRHGLSKSADAVFEVTKHGLRSEIRLAGG